MTTATHLSNIAAGAAQIPDFVPVAPQPGVRVTQCAAAAPVATTASARVAGRITAIRLASLIATIPADQRARDERFGRYALGRDDMTLVWIANDETPEKLAERERLGLEF